jgi:hypothetical protein
MLRARIREFFETETQQLSEEILAIVRASLEARHSVVHSIWTPAPMQRQFEVGTLQEVQSQQELDDLILNRGASLRWTTFHPKTGLPGPQTSEEIKEIRVRLEEAMHWLTALRFRLASALYVGKPSGAREVLDSRDL